MPQQNFLSDFQEEEFIGKMWPLGLASVHDPILISNHQHGIGAFLI